MALIQAHGEQSVSLSAPTLAKKNTPVFSCLNEARNVNGW